MKAMKLISHGAGATSFKLEEAQKPTVHVNEALIKIQGFGLNFADVMARRGLYQDAPPLPSILGYEVVGIVEALGASDGTLPSSDLKVGDRVVAMTVFGGYAEYAVTKALACAKINPEMRIDEACALATQFCTAYYAAEKKVSIMAGDRVLIHAAAGGVGVALIQFAKRRGAYVIATVGSEAKFDLVRSLGADKVINYQTHDFSKELIKDFGKECLDFIFDSIGGKTFHKGYNLLRPTGTIIGFGAAENAKSGLKLINGIKLLSGFGIYSPAFMLMQSKSIIGVNMLRVAEHKPLAMKEVLDEVVALYQSGAIKPVSGGLFPVAQLGEAHDKLESRKSTGKLAVYW